MIGKYDTGNFSILCRGYKNKFTIGYQNKRKAG